MIGSQLVAYTLLGVAIDWVAGWLPWATVAMTLLGLVAVLIQIGRAAMVSGGAPKGSVE